MPLPLRYSLGNLAARRTRTLLTVAVVALVVLAITLFLGLVSSIERTLATTGSETAEQAKGLADAQIDANDGARSRNHDPKRARDRATRAFCYGHRR